MQSIKFAALVVAGCLVGNTGALAIISYNPALPEFVSGGSVERNSVQIPLNGSVEFVLEDPAQSNLGAFDIFINAGAGLAANPAALAAFNRAAAQWESFISDPITINIDADLGILNANMEPFDAGILASASSVILSLNYTAIRNALVADAAGEADDGIVASLPTVAQFSTFLPVGFGLDGDLSANKANLKALGAIGLDATFGATDATITFNSAFSFDFDNSDGVGAGLTDFETVAAHEIGHALGFTSVVDEIDARINASLPSLDISPRTLDLFRFEDGSANDPDSAAEFTTATRNLVPGDVAIFDEVLVTAIPGGEGLLSTGLSQGDGRQASHWQDNALTGVLIGALDPTLAPGEVYVITAADARVLDLIGYDILSPIPEPGSAVLVAFASVVCLLRRRRR